MRAVLLSIFLAALVSLVAIPLLVSAFTFTRPLSYGAKGNDVVALQQYLKDQGYFHYPDITGYFGSYTWRALAAFQWDNNLEPVGYVGPKSELVLNKLLDQSLASLATSTSAASTAPTATSTISLVPTPPPAPIYTTPPPTPAMGQPWQAVSGGGGGGGPPAATPAPTPPPAPAPYVAQAVHFDLKTAIQQVGFTIPDASSYVESFWIRYDGTIGAPNLIDGNGDRTRTADVDVPDTIDTEIGGFFSSTDIAVFNSHTGAPTYLGSGFASQPGPMTPGSWHHVFVAVDVNHPTGEKIGFLYVDGVSVLDPTLSYDTTAGAYSISFHNNIIAVPTGWAGVSTDGELDYADFQMWVGTFIDPSAPANLAKFISGGKPVDTAISAAAF
jgi:peptidoglycan hydrolase-like protein with peptidoglycan-binding domain